jgi:two-component system, response regulator PdtaR
MDDFVDRDTNRQRDERILLVEDERIVALSEARRLEDRGYSVTAAASGEEAIELLERGLSPDVVLMDLDLGPGIGGDDAAEAILDRWELPIVFLSSFGRQVIEDRVRGINHCGCVLKGSSDSILVSSIEAAIGGASPRFPSGD